MKDEHEQRRAKVTDEHRREAAELKKIWDRTAAKRAAAGVGSQLTFGARYNIGTQGVVGFFLNGKTPLSLKAARGFAEGLGCKVGDFSPRLAALLEPPAAPAPGTRRLVVNGIEMVVEGEAELTYLTHAMEIAKRLQGLNETKASAAVASMLSVLKSFEDAPANAGCVASAPRIGSSSLSWAQVAEGVAKSNRNPRDLHLLMEFLDRVKLKVKALEAREPPVASVKNHLEERS